MSTKENTENKEQKADDSEFGFQLTPELKATIHKYLDSRPMAESEALIQTMFETKDPNPYYSSNGVKILTDYLSQKCPRREAKPLIDAMRNGGLLQFKITRPTEKVELKATVKEEIAAEKKD